MAGIKFRQTSVEPEKFRQVGFRFEVSSANAQIQETESMSKGNNKAFLKNPVGYSQKHMLLIGNGLRSTTTAQATAKGDFSSDLAPKAHYLSVSKGVRVLSCNIKPTESRDRATMAAGTVDVDVRDVTNAQPNDFPIFFLPWAADHVVKIKLSDPRVNPGGDVKIFFTAAVDGCSVFVEGDPSNPTVYHANAMSHNPGTLDPNVTAEMINLRRARAQQMKDRLLFARGDGRLAFWAWRLATHQSLVRVPGPIHASRFLEISHSPVGCSLPGLPGLRCFGPSSVRIRVLSCRRFCYAPAPQNYAPNHECHTTRCDYES